jgi:hypothetical protein
VSHFTITFSFQYTRMLFVIFFIYIITGLYIYIYVLLLTFHQVIVFSIFYVIKTYTSNLVHTTGILNNRYAQSQNI